MKTIPPIGRSLLLWLSTHAFASVIYFIVLFIDIDPTTSEVVDKDHTVLFIILFLGLLFSSPIIFFLGPLVYSLAEIDSRIRRLIYGGLGILILCALVVYGFCVFFRISSPEIPDIIIFLLPYVVGAELSLLIMLWNVHNFKSDNAYESKDDTIDRS